MWQHAICHKIYQSRRGGPGRNLKSCANQASFLAPCVGLIFILVIRQHGARYVRVIRITCALLLGSLGIPGLLQSRWCHESSMLSGLWTGGNRRYQAVALQLGYALRSLSSTPANVRRALFGPRGQCHRDSGFRVSRPLPPGDHIPSLLSVIYLFFLKSSQKDSRKAVL